MSRQPNIELSYFTASRGAKFISEQQTQNPDKHFYIGYVQTPKERAAFDRVKGYVKGSLPKEEKRTQTTLALTDISWKKHWKIYISILKENRLFCNINKIEERKYVFYKICAIGK